MVKLPLSVFVPSLVAIASLVAVVTGFALRSSAEVPLLGGGTWVDAAGGCTTPALHGRWVLLGFFQPDEAESRREAERLVELRSEYAGKELLVAAVMSVPPREVREFLRSIEAGYPALAGADGDFEAYGVRRTPACFLLDPAGTVRANGLVAVEAELRLSLPPDPPAPGAPSDADARDEESPAPPG